MSHKARSFFQMAKLATGTLGARLVGKDLASRYLNDQLSRIPGMPTKMGQLLSQKLGSEVHSTSSQALPIEEVLNILEADESSLFSELLSVNEEPKRASISQVHFGELRNGKAVAIKVQLPEMNEILNTQWDIIRKIALNFSPSFCQPQQLMDKLKQDFLDELDFVREAQMQELFLEKFKSSSYVVIPCVYHEYSNDHIICQEMKLGQNLEHIKKRTVAEREKVANDLYRFFMQSVFEYGLLHGDLHFGNWAYDFKEQNVIIYDFGSSLILDNTCREALIQLACSSHEDPQETKQLFARLGFSEMPEIEEQLPELARLLFEPFENDDWDWREWNLGERIDELIGEHKWNFRSSGPSWFLLFMRSVSSLLQVMKALDVCVPLNNIFENLGFKKEVKREHTTETKSSCMLDPLSSHLHIEVKRDGVTRVSLEFPARSASRLESLMSPEIATRIRNKGYDLKKMEFTSENSNYKPQVLFEDHSESQSIKVWLD